MRGYYLGLLTDHDVSRLLYLPRLLGSCLSGIKRPRPSRVGDDLMPARAILSLVRLQLSDPSPPRNTYIHTYTSTSPTKEPAGHRLPSTSKLQRGDPLSTSVCNTTASPHTGV